MENLRGWSQTDIIMLHWAMADSSEEITLVGSVPSQTALQSPLTSDYSESAHQGQFMDPHPSFTGQPDLMLFHVSLSSSLELSLCGLSNLFPQSAST